MNDELPSNDEPKKNRRPAELKTRAPRASSASRYSKKVNGFNGSHRRRNKHWNW